MIETMSMTVTDEQHAAVVRGRVARRDLAGFLDWAFPEVSHALSRQGLSPTGPPICRYHLAAPASPTDSDGLGAFDVAAGFPCDTAITGVGEVVPAVLPGGSVLTALHVGPWSDVGEVYEAAETWLARHDLIQAGDPWEIGRAHV